MPRIFAEYFLPLSASISEISGKYFYGITGNSSDDHWSIHNTFVRGVTFVEILREGLRHLSEPEMECADDWRVPKARTRAMELAMARGTAKIQMHLPRQAGGFSQNIFCLLSASISEISGKYFA
jgi:hypothetical protein